MRMIQSYQQSIIAIYHFNGKAEFEQIQTHINPLMDDTGHSKEPYCAPGEHLNILIPQKQYFGKTTVKSN